MIFNILCTLYIHTQHIKKKKKKKKLPMSNTDEQDYTYITIDSNDEDWSDIEGDSDDSEWKTNESEWLLSTFAELTVQYDTLRQAYVSGREQGLYDISENINIISRKKNMLRQQLHQMKTFVGGDLERRKALQMLVERGSDDMKLQEDREIIISQITEDVQEFDKLKIVINRMAVREIQLRKNRTRNIELYETETSNHLRYLYSNHLFLIEMARTVDDLRTRQHTQKNITYRIMINGTKYDHKVPSDITVPELRAYIIYTYKLSVDRQFHIKYTLSNGIRAVLNKYSKCPPSMTLLFITF